MKVKVCGVTRPEDARLACELGAWAVGLVFAAHSPRRLTIEAARGARAHIRSGVLAVGVFEGNSAEEIEKTARALRLDAVQTPGPYAGSAPLLSVVSPGLEPVPGAAAALVEPPRSPQDRLAGRKVGSDEQRRAWSWARELSGRYPLVVVAGGLSPDNAAEAARVSGAGAVDVSSGVESAPGIKDAAMMRRFFEALAA